MFTVCPKCALTLVVTAADLRVAQGYVRCGRCSNVFNALNALSDERHPEQHAPGAIAAATPAAVATPPPAPEPAASPEEPPAAAAAPSQSVAVASAEPPLAVALHDELEGEEIFEGEAEPPGESLEFDPSSTSVEQVFLAPQPGDEEATGTFESIVLEGGDPEADAGEIAEEDAEREADAAPEPAPDPDRELDQELQSLAQRIEAQGQQEAAKDFSSSAQGIAPSAAETLRELSGGIGDSPSSDYDEEDESRAPPWAWRAGVAALVLLLVAQATHHYRRDLAVVPQLNAPLTAIYRALGISLEPRWNVAAYEVRQLGAATDPAATDRLVVRASVKNTAPRPQPLPLLRIAVQDRFGNRIASRDVVPAAYSPRTMSPQALLASGQRVDIEMSFVDPGTQAVGFEIDACLAAPGGGVNCANR